MMSKYVFLVAALLVAPLAGCGGCTTTASQQPDKAIHEVGPTESPERELSATTSESDGALVATRSDYAAPAAQVSATTTARERIPVKEEDLEIEPRPQVEMNQDPSPMAARSQPDRSSDPYNVEEIAVDAPASGGEAESEAEVAVPPAPPRRQPVQRPANEPADDSQMQRQAFWIPAGTVIEARLAETLSSKTHRIGDSFNAILEKDLKAGNRVVVPRGTTLVGKILLLEESGKVKGRARMAFALEELVYLGQPYPLETNTIELEAASSKKRDATVVGGAAAVGALIGAITGGKKGAAVGAATGAGAGTAGVLLTRGQAVEVEAERLFSFRLERDFSIVVP